MRLDRFNGRIPSRTLPLLFRWATNHTIVVLLALSIGASVALLALSGASSAGAFVSPISPPPPSTATAAPTNSPPSPPQDSGANQSSDSGGGGDGGGGGSTSQSATSSTPTPNPLFAETNTNPVVGGNLVSIDGAVVVLMPGGASNMDLVLRYRRIEQTEITPPNGQRYIGAPFDLTAVLSSNRTSHVFNFEKPILIVVHYNDAEIAGLNPLTFRIAFYNGTQWVYLPSVVDTSARKVTAETTHFTLFSLLGSSLSSTSSPGVGATPPTAVLTSAPAKPGFILGFKTLAGMIPEIVGGPLENERSNPINGDSLQLTANGLLVWRKADNWTAFTDGFMTWINGPNGLEKRGNDERLPWEAR